ncbi:hypothetical protein [Sinorhizobium mexicanum]|uniref:hypothetical protein n=1 Tax=Sinorhizobium mexicanum TaxID=375549 RepID=UPI0015DDC331|nr:hypothetical protein [Sinorhizobium mexicanum]MBP1882417.1 hypothetical protein [Sinorhizobium mexicanum]
MLKFIATTFLAAAPAVSAFAAGQSGEPQYFVKAWLQKVDKRFEHTTGWCDASYFCSLTIGDHTVKLREIGHSRYFVSFETAPSERERCCLFAGGTAETMVKTGRPHVETLYDSAADVADGGDPVEFGKIIILVEDLKKPEPDWWQVTPVRASPRDTLQEAR